MLTSQMILLNSCALSAARRTVSTLSAKNKERLLILGSGWGGYNVARQVDKKLFDVTVISPNSYFSFTPFLASTAVGTLEYRCATEPVRGIKHVHYAQGWANQIDFSKRTVEVEPALSPDLEDVGSEALEKHRKGANQSDRKALEHYKLPYDQLVIAVGCYSASFGIPGVEKHAHFLKDIRDARAIRNKTLERFEQALHPATTPEQRQNLLHFAIVGGGPTGVEFAAELHDFVKEDVYRLYPELEEQVRIRLYDVASGILMSFDESLREYAEGKFAREGVEVRPNSKITAVGKDWIELDGGKREPFGLLVWSTGLSANPLMESITDTEHDQKSKSLIVDDRLKLLDNRGQAIPGVFAIGDNAMPKSGRLPATAQVASQQAKYVSKVLGALAGGASTDSTPVFKWKNRGSMVLIGEKKGLVERSADTIAGPKNRLHGLAAWLVWRSYYMTLAMGWRNKILIPVYWSLAWMFGRDVTRF